jgi:asparagine synthase (glutamine-hydrolysing)
MSAIAGIVFADRRPVPAATLDTLSRFNEDRAPGRRGSFTAPGVALLHHALPFDELSRAERQPRCADDGSIVTFDGRLDNREDLLIRFRRVLAADLSDAALVGAAYAKDGVECLRYLIGDWSLAIWDPGQDRLILARDFAGNRPLYYLQQADVLSWSTCLDTLATLFDRYQHPSEEYIAATLTFGRLPRMTPFNGIEALPPAHVLTWHPSRKTHLSRYWTFDLSPIRLRTQGDCDERLRTLLTEAIRVRLRADRPVWAQLSGGYDSSTVVCIANTLVRDGLVAAPALRPVSRVFAASPESDEREFIEAVEAWCGLTSLRFDPPQDVKFIDLLVSRRPFPMSRQSAIPDELRTSEDSVLLSGEAGDLIMAKNSVHAVALLENLHALRLKVFWRDCKKWSWRSRTPMVKLLATLAAAYIPASRYDARRRQSTLRMTAARSRRKGNGVADVFGLAPEFAARMQPHPLRVGDELRDCPYAKRPLVAALYSVLASGATSSVDTVPFVRLTYPFMHRPLVQFVLQAPHRALWEPGAVRGTMRRAFAGIVPPAVLERQGKGYAPPAILRNLRALIGDSLPQTEEWQIVIRGYVAPRALDRALDGLRHGSPMDEAFLRTCIGLEAWLRSCHDDTPQERAKATAAATAIPA